MKKLIVLALGLTALLLGVAVAGDYHTGTTLYCNECHVMHYSQTHGYNANGTGNYVALAPGGPFPDLLRANPNDLCLSCHDGKAFAPDVLAANGGNVPTNGRQAGALNNAGTAGGPYFASTGHTLGSIATPPGANGSSYAPGTAGLMCINCHDNHGNALYRNAVTDINGAPATAVMTYAVGTNDLTKDIFERSAAMGGDHYSPNNVDFNEPNQAQSGYGSFCKQCHTDFHGNTTNTNMFSGGMFVRHPTADANIAGPTFASKAYRLKVMSSTGAWGTNGTPWVGAPTDLTPSCMTCHKAHGNQNAFGLIFATGTVAFGEDGEPTAQYSDLCRNCHSK